MTANGKEPFHVTITEAPPAPGDREAWERFYDLLIEILMEAEARGEIPDLTPSQD
jgi:hypothetical protein